MRKYARVLTIILYALLTACIDKTEYNTLLIQADSLMQPHPDSALYLLKSIPTDSLKTKAERAYYALLLTQAQDKNYVMQTDDSLIRSAVQYYNSTKECQKQAQAYYYWGNVYRDKNNYPQAIDKYHTALSYANQLKNTELKASLYSNLGYLYYTQDLNHEADSLYQQAELLAISQKDTISLCYTLLQRGMINLEQGKENYSKAELQMLQALTIGKKFSDSSVLVPVYHSLSTLYGLMPKPRQALKYASLNYAYLKDTLHCYRTFLLLGHAHFLNNQYDSADIFLKKTLKAERYYDTKKDACMLLSQIAQKKGNMETALLWERKRSIYQDSAQTCQQTHGILNSIITHEKNNSKTIKKQSMDVIYTISAILIAVNIFYIVQLRRKHLQYKAEKKKWEDKLQTEIAQTNNRKQRLAEKEQENAILQEKVNQLMVKKQVYQKEEYKISSLYAKVSRIAKDLQRIETKENLNEEEWIQFIALTNTGWYGIISYLDETYNLSAEEMRICCLYLAQVPVMHMGHFLHIQSRSTIQSKSKEISLKIGIPHGLSLKNALFSLAEQLKSFN